MQTTIFFNGGVLQTQQKKTHVVDFFHFGSDKIPPSASETAGSFPCLEVLLVAPMGSLVVVDVKVLPTFR